MKKPIKTCKNTDCVDAIVDYKSSKKEYCNDYCRNHAGHLRRKIENEEFQIFEKGMKVNYTLLKMFYDKNIFNIEFELVERLGYNTKYLPEQKIYEIEGQKSAVYIIKNIAFKISSDNKEIIFLKKI